MKPHQRLCLLGSLFLIAVFPAQSLADTTVGAESASRMPTEASLGVPFGSVDIPDVLDEAAAMNACVKAATGRKWRIMGREGNILWTNLKLRGWDATVYYVVKDGSVRLYSDSYTVDKKTGEHKKKEDPKGWLNNLVKDVTVFMDRAAYGE